jgi:hypothetical protein
MTVQAPDHNPIPKASIVVVDDDDDTKNNNATATATAYVAYKANDIAPTGLANNNNPLSRECPPTDHAWELQVCRGQKLARRREVGPKGSRSRSRQGRRCQGDLRGSSTDEMTAGKFHHHDEVGDASWHSIADVVCLFSAALRDARRQAQMERVRVSRLRVVPQGDDDARGMESESGTSAGSMCLSVDKDPRATLENEFGTMVRPSRAR